MANGLPQYSGLSEPRTKQVYFAGTDTLEVGYNLCYDASAGADAADPKDRLGVLVAKPVTADLNAYAGVVVAKQTGPAFVIITIPQRGEYVEALTDANMTLATTALAPQNGSYALAAHSDSGLNLPFVAVAGETVNTDTVNANARIAFR